MITISICIYSNKNYKILKINNNKFLLQNTDREFKYGHTHIYNYNIGKIIIYCCINGNFPSKYKKLEKNKRILESIIRVCGNKYKDNFIDLLSEVKNKE